MDWGFARSVNPEAGAIHLPVLGSLVCTLAFTILCFLFLAWKYLGTAERMTELGTFIERAGHLAASDLEKQRVRTWQEGVWNYMLEGRRMYQAKQE